MTAWTDHPALEHFADWLAGEVAEAEGELLEQHLFGCARCLPLAQRAAHLTEALRGYAFPVISRARLEELRRDGARTRHTAVEPGVPVTVAFSGEVDLLIHELHGPLAGAERVDVEIEAAGHPVSRLEHAAFDAERGEVLIACQRHYLEIFPAEIVFRVRAHRGGRVDDVGRYTVVHTL